MIFGLNRATDEQSLKELLHRFADSQVTDTIIPRLSDQEIQQLTDTIFDIVHKHLSHEEYHKLLLDD